MEIHELPNGTPTSSDYLAIDNGTSRKTGFSSFELGDNNVTFSSGDTTTPVSWQSVSALASGTLKSVLNGVSTMMANSRYMWGLIGSTVMGTTATTITGAIAEIVAKLGNNSMGTTATTITGAIYELSQKLTQTALINAIPGLLTRGDISDFDDATATGNYTYSSSSAHRPTATPGGTMVNAGGQCNVYRASGSYIAQVAFQNSTSSTAPPNIYVRRSYAVGSWTDWYKITLS